MYTNYIGLYKRFQAYSSSGDICLLHNYQIDNDFLTEFSFSFVILSFYLSFRLTIYLSFLSSFLFLTSPALLILYSITEYRDNLNGCSKFALEMALLKGCEVTSQLGDKTISRSKNLRKKYSIIMSHFIFKNYVISLSYAKYLQF